MTKLVALALARPAVAIAVIISAAILIAQIGVGLLAGVIANDFSVYWRTANGPLGEVYSTAFEFPFPYAPTMIFWVAPLKLLPMWPAFVIWTAAGVAALLWTCRDFLTRNERWLLALCPPVTSCLATGQVTIVLGALMIWSFGAKNRLAAGIVLGLVATIKPQLVLMAPLFLLLRSDWRALAGSAASFAIAVMLSLIVFGPSLWTEWLASLDNFRTVLHREAILSGGVTPAAVAENWGFPPQPFLVAGIIAGAWLVYRCRNANPLEATAAVTAASLLAAPYGLVYDLTPIAPFLIWSAFRGRLTSALALSGTGSPAPLILAGFDLVKRARQDGRIDAPPACPASVAAG